MLAPSGFLVDAPAAFPQLRSHGQVIMNDDDLMCLLNRCPGIEALTLWLGEEGTKVSLDTMRLFVPQCSQLRTLSFYGYDILKIYIYIYNYIYVSKTLDRVLTPSAICCGL